MQLSTISLAITRLGGAAFSPLSLFDGGIQGTWYDPSDLTTLFQDSAGTTPVTGVEQVVGLMLDKSQGLVLGTNLTDPLNFTAPLWTVGANVTNVTANSFEATGNATGLNSTTLLQPNKWYQITMTYTKSNSASFSVRFDAANDVVSFTATSGTVTGIGFSSATDNIYFRAATPTVITITSISIRELPGNHATSTATAKPTLSARYNLLTYSEEFDNAYWAKGSITVSANTTTAPDGTSTADTMLETVADSRHVIESGQSSYPAGTYTVSCFVKANGRTAASIYFGTASHIVGAFFDLSAPSYVFSKTLGSVVSLVGTPTITDFGSGWYRLAAVFSLSSAITGAMGVACSDRITDTGAYVYASASYVGDITKGLYIWGAQLLTAADVTATGNAYQRVAAATVYDTSNSVFRPYLAFDGTQAMSTGSINFTATDKMTVWAGVTRLIDASFPMIAELSAAGWDNATGTFGVSGGSGSARWRMGCRGTATTYYDPETYTPPITNVLSSEFNLGGASKATTIVPRVNSVVEQEGGVGTTAGGGNFASHPLWVGMRGGSGLPFTGRIYSLITRGAQSTAAEVSATESWVNQRTGAY